MAGYTKTSDTTGVMTMSDNGTTISFYFQAGYSNDYWSPLKFSYTANGTTTNKDINYTTGRPKVLIGSVSVKTSQTVTFKLLTATGTNGMGGPTTFSRAFTRASVPGATTTPALSNITSSSIKVVFSRGSDGGATIDQYQIGYGKSSTSVQYTVGSTGTTTIGGLAAATTWYFWARAHNSVGWSAWSARASAKTLSAVIPVITIPGTPSPPIVKSATATTATLTWVAPNNGGASITEYQIGYGADPNTPQLYEGSSTDMAETISGLVPGVKYYFWIRAKNSVGWSEWSARSGSSALTNSSVMLGDIWLRGTPYVNVGGVWKVAEPWVKVAGVWKKAL